jgi:Cu2+-exporting ATPase
MSATLAVGDIAGPEASCDAATGNCFHCGLSLPAQGEYRVRIEGVDRPMCCAGCSAVAETIVSSGLSEYYRARKVLPKRADPPPTYLPDLAAYDLPNLGYARTPADGRGLNEATLSIEGIRCAACAWLNERHVAQLPGVADVSVNYATHRMRVRWDAGRIALSCILKSISDLGYRARPFDPARHAEAAATTRRSSLKRLAIAGLGMMQVMMFSVPIYIAGEGDIAPDQLRLMLWASFIITLPVLIYSGAEFFTASWRGVRHGRLTMDVPVALGLTTAFMASTWATVVGRGDVYFDSVTMFVFLLLGARFLEQELRFKAGNAVDQITSTLPASAQRLVDFPYSRNVERVALASISAGDCLLVPAGMCIPADGAVIEGISTIDESLVTGESRPVTKRAGDALIAGTVNQVSPLIIRSTRVGADSTVAHIARLVERALAEKPAVARLADRAAGWFVVTLLTLTLATIAFWWNVAPERLLPITIALLVITCPCALGLAAPAALTAGTYRLTRLGLLPTRGHAMETLTKVTDVVIDKTGTLTVGRPQLIQVRQLSDMSESQAINIAAALEAASEHPLGKALFALPHEPLLACNITNHPGGGIEGMVEGRSYRIGSVGFVSGLAGPPPRFRVEPGKTTVALGCAAGWSAAFVFADALRADARDAIARLHALGKQVHLLSGDSPEVTARVAAQAEIARSRGGVSPAQKLDYVQNLQRGGAVVAMVGDGVNDAPGLGGAQVSIAMGSGTDVAQSAADFVLLSGNLGAIPRGIAIARSARRIMSQNLAWAAAYNLVAVPLAALGLVTPWVAAIGMASSSLIVVLNALRLAPLPRRHAALRG